MSLTLGLRKEHTHIPSYSSLTIGLLGLLGLIGAILAPQWGRLVDKIVPWLGQLLGLCTSLTSMVIALSAADRSVGAVCVSIILYDCGQQLFQVSSTYRIAGIDPQARARLNGCYLLCVFVGQVSHYRFSQRHWRSDAEMTASDIWNSHPHQDLQQSRLETYWSGGCLVCRCRLDCPLPSRPSRDTLARLARRIQRTLEKGQVDGPIAKRHHGGCQAQGRALQGRGGGIGLARDLRWRYSSRRPHTCTRCWRDWWERLLVSLLLGQYSDGVDPAHRSCNGYAR